jgi:hypothetical protein
MGGGVMGGGQPRSADRPMPHYRPAPEYPPLLDDLRMPGYPPAASNPPVPDHPISKQLQVAAWPAAPEYPAVPHYLSVRGHPPVPDWPAATVLARGGDPPGTPRWPTARFLRHRAGALLIRGALPRRHAADAAGGRRAAVLGYLTVPVFLVPVAIYLTTLRGSGWARRHAAQAVNVWFTGLLYDLSAVIMGAMLALDSPPVALMVVAPLVAARWLVTLAYLASAARAAGRGAEYAFPAWLCMRVAR